MYPVTNPVNNQVTLPVEYTTKKEEVTAKNGGKGPFSGRSVQIIQRQDQLPSDYHETTLLSIVAKRSAGKEASRRLLSERTTTALMGRDPRVTGFCTYQS